MKTKKIMSKFSDPDKMHNNSLQEALNDFAVFMSGKKQKRVGIYKKFQTEAYLNAAKIIMFIRADSVDLELLEFDSKRAYTDLKKLVSKE
jgi:hypothetical protein